MPVSFMALCELDAYERRSISTFLHQDVEEQAGQRGSQLVLLEPSSVSSASC